MIDLQTGEISVDHAQSSLGGVQTPRICTKLNDLPSKGQEMIDFAGQLGIQLMDWQKFVAIHAHKVKEDDRWATNEVGLLLSRQNGKSTFMMLRILTGMFVWGEGWHNNHHANPNDWRFGQKWWQIDVAGYLIRMVKK